MINRLLIARYYWSQEFDQWIENPRVGGSIPPPGTIFQCNINDLVFAHLRYACRIQKHTKHTLFHVFVCGDSEVQHCVSNLVKEHSSC